MILRFLRALRAANHRLEDWFDDLSRKTRRIIAVAVVLVILGVAMLGSALGQADYERSGQLVLTEERHRSVIVGHRPEGRGNTVPIVRTGSQELDLDYGWFLDNDEVGSTVEYVIDPDDPSHLIAVGQPSDWQRSTTEDNLITVVMCLFAVVIAGLVAMRIVPDDFAAVFEWHRRRRKPVPRRRRGGGRH